MKARLAPEAEADLDRIWDFVARKTGSVEPADRLIDALSGRFLLLSNHPYAGRRRDHDLRPGLRSFPAGDYVIFYRVSGAATLSCAFSEEAGISKGCWEVNFRTAKRAAFFRFFAAGYFSQVL